MLKVLRNAWTNKMVTSFSRKCCWAIILHFTYIFVSCVDFKASYDITINRKRFDYDMTINRLQKSVIVRALPRTRFPNDNFWPPRRTVPEFWLVTGHGKRKKCIIFWPRATPGWGRGAPQTPPPPQIKMCAFQHPRNIFEKKIVGKKLFRPPPPPPPIFFAFQDPRNIFGENLFLFQLIETSNPLAQMYLIPDIRNIEAVPVD